MQNPKDPTGSLESETEQITLSVDIMDYSNGPQKTAVAITNMSINIKSSTMLEAFVFTRGTESKDTHSFNIRAVGFMLFCGLVKLARGA